MRRQPLITHEVAGRGPAFRKVLSDDTPGEPYPVGGRSLPLEGCRSRRQHLGCVEVSSSESLLARRVSHGSRLRLCLSGKWPNYFQVRPRLFQGGKTELLLSSMEKGE